MSDKVKPSDALAAVQQQLAAQAEQMRQQGEVIEQLRRQLADASLPTPLKAAALSTDAMGQLIEEQRQALAVAMADRAATLRQQQQSKEDLERIRAECQKSARQRTQEAADRLFQGPRRFRVAVPKDAAQPVIEINGHSPEEAKGRYLALCGILSTEHTVQADDVNEPAQEDRPRKAKAERVDPLVALHAEL